MKKIKEILKNVEGREELEKALHICMKEIECEDVYWENFVVYKNSEGIVENMLKKSQPQYLMAVVEKVKMSGMRDVTVKIAVTVNKLNLIDEVEVVRRNLGEIMAVIILSPETKNYLNR